MEAFLHGIVKRRSRDFSGPAAFTERGKKTRFFRFFSGTGHACCLHHTTPRQHQQHPKVLPTASPLPWLSAEASGSQGARSATPGEAPSTSYRNIKCSQGGQEIHSRAHCPQEREPIYEPKRLPWAQHEADLDKRHGWRRSYRMEKGSFHKLVELLRPSLEVDAFFGGEC